MNDIIKLMEFLENSVEPYKWITELSIYDNKTNKYYTIEDLYLKRNDKSECMIIEIDTSC